MFLQGGIILFNGNLYTVSESGSWDAIQEAFEKKHDVDFVRAHLHDYVLADMFSPEVLREVKTQMDQLPWYIKKSIPQPLLKVMTDALESEWPALLQEHYTKQAIDSLTYCADCAVPYSKDPRVFQVRRDLLSSAGHAVLADLTEKQLPVSEESLDKVMSVANKFLVPCRLFKPLQDFSFLFSEKDPCDVSLTSGCYNGCVHCGIDAQPLVSHMPFPVAKQIIWYLRDHGIINQKLFFDSDPLAYRSPAFGGVDMGDIYGMYPAGVPLTKGVLIGTQDELALAKIARQRSLGLSLVDIEGENITQNLARISRSIDIITDVKQDSFYVVVYQVEGKRSEPVEKFIEKFEAKYGAYNWYPQDVLPVGRGSNLPVSGHRNITNSFASADLLIAADGSVYDVYGVKNGTDSLPLADEKVGREGTFAFQWLGDVITDLPNLPVASRHPTVYTCGGTAKPNEPLHRLVCSVPGKVRETGGNAK